MSKIDDYNKIKQLNGNDIERLHLSRGRYDRKGEPDHKNDKGCFNFYDHKIWDDDMTFAINSCYGYYGSSSAYATGSENIRKYVLKVLNSKSNEIILEAIKLMGADIEKARLACLEEAKQILQEVEE